MTDKWTAIKALDGALDKEIIHYAEKFAKAPGLRTLGILCKLVTVDMYADEYLEEHEEAEPRVGMAVK